MRISPTDLPQIPTTATSNELAPGSIFIEAVSKRFRKHTLAKASYSTLKTSLLNQIFRARYPRGNYLTVLSAIDLHIRPGESVGIIGRNGSGKSTLLKLIAGIYRPDSGRINVKGRISALIELGAGFHPDFTGRENIHLGGTMYGLTRDDINRKFDDIVGYAGLEDFIDDPVRTYSSGMYMRLGFSLAIHTNPDILLIDEVLAVGDAAFVHRCQETISEFHRLGKTLLVISHDLGSVVKWCDKAVWLEKGNLVEQGEPKWVVDCYLQKIEGEEEQELAKINKDLLQDSSRQGIETFASGDLNNGHISDGVSVSHLSVDSKQSTEKDLHDSASSDTLEPQRWGNGYIQITSLRMLGDDGEARWVFHTDELVAIEVSYEIHRTIDNLVFGIGILRADGFCVHGSNTEIDGLTTPLPDWTSISNIGDSHRQNLVTLEPPYVGSYTFTIARLGLVEDTYYLDVAAHKSDGTPYDYHHRLHKFSVRSKLKYHGVYTPEHTWTFRVPERKKES